MHDGSQFRVIISAEHNASETAPYRGRFRDTFNLTINILLETNAITGSLSPNVTLTPRLMLPVPQVTSAEDVLRCHKSHNCSFPE